MEIYSTLLRACGAGLILSLCLNILSNVSGGYASVIRIAGSTFLFGVFLLFLKEGIQALMPTTTVFSENAVAVEGVVSMLKGLGIALISRFCADICRDCGEHTIAGGVESVGRMAIFTLSVPMIAKILGVAVEMLGMSA